MKITFSVLAALAVTLTGLQTATSGDCFYGGPCADSGCDNGCCFNFDYIDVAYMSSDYTTDPAPGVLNGTIQTAPNASIVDEMKGVNVEFRKSIGCNFYLAGEFYNTDGFLSPSIQRARQNLVGDNLLTAKRAEFYYYRMGLGVSHCISDNLAVTFDAGGLFIDCEVPGKLEDEWGWYVSPGVRLCLGGIGEAYANYYYENYERMENHRFDGGVILPLPCSDCMSLKFGGRYESAFEKTTWLAGMRFNY